jgi:F-type H+-transporting ATPase subunit delta
MPRPTSAPRRYAEAAFEIAQRDRSLDEWRDDLRTAVQLVSNDQVDAIVDNPSIAFAERRAVLDELLSGRVRRPVQNLVTLLTERGRVELLPAIADEYARLLNRHRGIVEALVTSAAPLSADEAEQVRQRVRQMSGAEVELTSQVDESLIGGLTIRVGDRLLDASVRGRLERLRDELIAGTR